LPERQRSFAADDRGIRAAYSPRWFAAAPVQMKGGKMAIEREVAIKPDIVFAEHDGTKLLGDLYLPKGSGKAPVLVAVHGGGWQIGDRKFSRHWGSYLARNGYAVFAIEYRLMKPGVKTWPGVVGDCKSAVQFLRAKSADLGLDPDRIGMVGDSAGAHLAALVALAGDEPLFSSQYRNDPLRHDPSQHQSGDRLLRCLRHGGAMGARPDQPARAIQSPKNYLAVRQWSVARHSSRRLPLSYATVDKNSTRFLLVYGREDDIVDPVTESEKFLNALKQAGFFARTIVVPGAGHF
jgi:acetyl esterase/lipase